MRNARMSRRAGGSTRAAVVSALLVLVAAALPAAAASGAPAAPTAGPRVTDPLRPVSGPPVTHPGVRGATSPWQFLVNQPTFAGGAGAMELLTDGTVMVQQNSTGHWYRLTPDAKGGYVDATWSQLASMPAGYAPTAYASAVLPDGRVIVEGGEYNGTSATPVWTNQGAIYDPVANTWTTVLPPAGPPWSTAGIGDAQSTVLANGTFMLASGSYIGSGPKGSKDALLNASTLTWTITGTGKADANDEEGWSLLPDGQVLTVDITKSGLGTQGTGNNSEVYTPSTGAWTSAGVTPVPLATHPQAEIGPQLLRPGGTVFAAGANGQNAVFNTTTRTWSTGPSFPVVGGKQYVSADAPSAVLPGGDVLVAASPGVNKSPTRYYVFNGSTLNAVASAPNAQDPTYCDQMLVLPTGQILQSDCRGMLEIFTPGGSAPAAWQPRVTSVPTTLVAGSTNGVSGRQLNGLTQGAAYGDDYQSATNYPLVRITDTATGQVTYGRTFAMTSMTVAPGAASSAQFSLPAATPAGPSTLQVVANGIASTPVAVTITAPT